MGRKPIAEEWSTFEWRVPEGYVEETVRKARELSLSDDRVDDRTGDHVALTDAGFTAHLFVGRAETLYGGGVKVAERTDYGELETTIHREEGGAIDHVEVAEVTV